MFEIIDWQYKSIYTWCTHKCSNYVLTIQRLKKMGKKRTKSGGPSSAYNTIVLLDIEELWSHNVHVKAML